jgi:transposase-like protein
MDELEMQQVNVDVTELTVEVPVEQGDGAGGEVNLPELVVDGEANRLTKGSEVLHAEMVGVDGKKYAVVEVEDELIEGLTPDQRQALAMMLAGTKGSKIARELGVHRTTLHRWRKKHAGFTAAFNRWAEFQKDTAKAGLMELTETALAALRKAMEAGDGRLALKYFEGMGLLGGRWCVGPTDAEGVIQQHEIKKKKREAKWRKTMGQLGSDEMGLPPWA